MSKEGESRRRSPGIIARLMGMEGLPPQQPTHKEHKRSSDSDSYQRRTESVGLTRNNNQYEGYSHRKSSREEQEFKDVFEVVDATDGYNNRYPAERNTNSKLTEAKVALFRQKVFDAKRLSTDEYLQESREFDDTLEILDSNKHLFLRCLQERNSLFSKHVHDLQNPAAQSHNTHAVGRKTLEPRKSGRNGVCLIPERETTIRTTSYSQRDYDGYLSRHPPRATRKSSRSVLGEDDTSNVPTRIVVLKPSMGRVQAQTASEYVSSPHPSNSFRAYHRMQNGSPDVEGKRTERGSSKAIPPDEGLSRQKSKQSREIAKEVTKRIQISLSAESFDFPSSRFKGYAGDESSCYESGNESETESEVTTGTTHIRRQSFDWNDWRGISSSHSPGSSSVNKEAKKGLSKRWNTGHNPEEVVSAAERNNTLGEMLGISDMIGKAKRTARSSDLDGRCDRGASIQKSVRPLGISSKEGWNDGYMRNLSRTRSLPASSSAFRSVKTSTQNRTLSDDCYLIPNNILNLERSKAVKKHSNHRSGSSSKFSRSPARKLKAYHYTNSEDSDTAHDCLDDPNQMKNVPVKNVPSDENLFTSETSINNFTEPSDGDVVSLEVEVEHKDVILSSESLSDLLPHRPGSILPIQDNSSPQDSDNPTEKETLNELSEESSVLAAGPVLEPESLSIPKEAEQPSPVSVLEDPFLNDPPSGSGCFDTVTADLQGLRMQLRLLRSESEDYEGMIAISSDEEKMEEPVHIAEGIEMFIDEASWESSFMADVLISPGFGNVDSATFMSTWYSSECPIDPSLFQRLENKYGGHSNWSKCEAKLLFDRINSGLAENFQQFIEPCPWLKPSSRLVGGTRSEVTLEDDLYKLLERQETTRNTEDLCEAAMKTEPKWLHLEDVIYEIGVELENQLIDELVSEVVTL